MKKLLSAIVMVLFFASTAFGTVATSDRKTEPLSCNGVTTAFPFSFPIINETHLKVIVTSALGVETTLYLGTDYTVSHSGTDFASGGTVTILSTCVSGKTITIKRITPVTQSADYVENQYFSQNVLESNLDKLTMVTQELAEDVSRAPKLAETSTLNIILPNPSPDGYIGWNAAATQLENKSGPVIITATQYEVDALVSYGGGIAFTQAAIQSALTAIGTVNKTTLLLRPGTWVISSDADWSAYKNVVFRIVPGAVISHGAFTLNIPNRDIGAVPFKWLTGTGAVTFSGNVDIVYPDEYTTNTTPGTTDMTSAIDYTLATGENVRLLDTTYATTGAHVFSSQYGQKLQGTGRAHTTIKKLSGTSIIFSVGTTVSGQYITDLTIDANSLDGHAIKVTGSYHHFLRLGIKNVGGTGWAIYTDSTTSNSDLTIKDSFLQNNYGGIRLVGGNIWNQVPKVENVIIDGGTTYQLMIERSYGGYFQNINLDDAGVEAVWIGVNVQDAVFSSLIIESADGNTTTPILNIDSNASPGSTRGLQFYGTFISNTAPITADHYPIAIRDAANIKFDGLHLLHATGAWADLTQAAIRLNNTDFVEINNVNVTTAINSFYFLSGSNNPQHTTLRNVFSVNPAVGVNSGIIDWDGDYIIAENVDMKQQFQAAVTNVSILNSPGAITGTNLPATTNVVNSNLGIIQTITASGATAISVWAKNVSIDTTLGAQTSTLAAGYEGQEIYFYMAVKGGANDMVLTPAVMRNGTTITFNTVEDNILLRYFDSQWTVVSNNGCTIA